MRPLDHRRSGPAVEGSKSYVNWRTLSLCIVVAEAGGAGRRNFFLQNRRGLINIYEHFPPGSLCGMQWKAWPKQTQEKGSQMSVSKRHVLVLWCQGHSQFVS